MSKPYFAVATAPDIQDAYPVGVLDLDSGRDMDYREMNFNPVVFPSHVVQPTKVEYHQRYPGSQVISQIESKRISREMVKGDQEYENELLHEEDGIPESHLNAAQESKKISDRLKNSEYYKDRDEPFMPKGNSIPTYSKALSKEAKLAEKDRNYVPENNTEGYKMSDYKSVYENPGGVQKYETTSDPYDPSLTESAPSQMGYKVQEYKSEYDTQERESWRN